MAISFDIVGNLRAIKGNDKFKPYDVKDFTSGWQTTTYRFNVISGTNRITCEISGGKWKDDDAKNKIYTFKRSVNGEKSEKLTVDWKDRNDLSVISSVAGWKVYTLSLLTPAEKDKMEDNGQDDEIIAKTHQFIERIGYADCVKSIIDSEEYKDTKFRVLGTMDFQYSAEKGIYYRTMTVNKIYKCDEKTEPSATMTVDAYYAADALNTDMYESAGKAIFNCYTDYYFNTIKENRYVPLSLVIKKDQKWVDGFNKSIMQFDENTTIKKTAFICDIIDGAEMIDITMDDLSEEVKADIECGLITFEDVIKELGGKKAGDRLSEYRIDKRAQGYVTTACEPTLYTMEHMKALPIATTETTPALTTQAAETKNNDVEIDIFAENDEDEEI